MINKQEIKYLVIASIFAFVVFGYVIPYVIDGRVGNISPIVQFIVFNLSIFIFFNIFLKSITTGHKINISGTIGMIALFMALDILMPPLMVSFSGQLNSSVTLAASSSDYIIGLMFINLGLKGFWVYLATYVLSPIVLLLIAAKLMPNFVKSI